MHSQVTTIPFIGQMERPDQNAPVMLQELLAGDDEPPRPLVRGLIPLGALLILSGLPKVARKTFLMMVLAFFVSLGAMFLGRATTQVPVVYCFLEDGRRRARRRFLQLGAPRDRPVNLKAVFTAEQVAEELTAIERSGEPALVVIDSLVNYAVARGLHDENSATDIERLLKPLRDFVLRTGSTVVLVHHHRKAGDVMRGSVALQGSTDGWLSIHPEKDGTHRIDATLRDAEDSTLWVRWVTEGDRIRVEPADAIANLVPGAPRKAAAQSGSDVKVLAAIRAAATPMSESAVAASAQVSRGVARGALRRLEEGSQIVKTAAGFLAVSTNREATEAP